MTQKNSHRRWKIPPLIGLVLVTLLAVGLTIASSNPFPNSPATLPTGELSPELSPIKPLEIPTPISSSNQIEIPQISSTRIIADVEELAFERYSPSQLELARQYIIQQLHEAGWKLQQQEFEGGINLYADRPGTDPDAGIILVAAHYDTVAFSPGADDNATGVATVLEIARALGQRETVRSLRVAFFDQEESGLWGSLAFAGNEELRANLKAAIIIDMIGYACHNPGCQQYPAKLPVTPPSNKGDFLVVVGDAEHLPLLNIFHSANNSANNSVNNSANNSATTQGLNSPTIHYPQALTLPIPFKGILMPDTLRSDHAPFWYQGIGAVLVTDTANLRNPHYHRPTDLVETIDRSFFIGSAQVILNVTTHLLESRESLNTIDN